MTARTLIGYRIRRTVNGRHEWQGPYERADPDNWQTNIDGAATFSTGGKESARHYAELYGGKVVAVYRVKRKKALPTAGAKWCRMPDANGWWLRLDEFGGSRWFELFLNGGALQVNVVDLMDYQPVKVLADGLRSSWYGPVLVPELDS